MGKKAKALKEMVLEFEAALDDCLDDYHAEHTKRVAAEMELGVMEGIANMFHRDVQRLQEERDEAEKNVAELLRNNETADSVIRDLRRELEGFKRECSAHSLSLLGRLAATQRERDAALGNWQNAEDLFQERERELDELLERFEEFKRNAAAQVANLERQMQERQQPDYAVNQALINGLKRLKAERDAAREDVAMLTEANAEADDLIGALRADLADTREWMNAALTEAARMRKEWAGDVTAAREIVERKSYEIVELRRDVAAAQREYESAIRSWSGTESLLQERERELDTLQAQHAAVSEALDLAREYSAKTIGDLRYEVAKLQACQTPVICSRWRRDILAKDDAAPAEPVAVNAVTLQKIDALDIGERLIDEDGMMVGRRRDDYYVFKPGLGTYSTTNYDSTLRLYQELKAKA